MKKLSYFLITMGLLFSWGALAQTKTKDETNYLSYTFYDLYRMSEAEESAQETKGPGVDEVFTKALMQFFEKKGVDAEKDIPESLAEEFMLCALTALTYKAREASSEYEKALTKNKNLPGDEFLRTYLSDTILQTGDRCLAKNKELMKRINKHKK